MSTTFSPEDRAALVALLERFNLSVESFDALRADAYEQQLARQSVEHLELLYTKLLTPALKPEEIQVECPAWPKGTKFAGQLPGISMLYKIAERLRTEQALNSLGRVSGFLDQLRSRASALPVGKQTEVLDTIVTLVGEEMLQAKLGGTPVSANLDPLDRLLSNKALAIRERERRDKREKWEMEAAEKMLNEALRQRADEIANSNLSNAEKIAAMRQAAFKDVDELEASGKVVIPK